MSDKQENASSPLGITRTTDIVRTIENAVRDVKHACLRGIRHSRRLDGIDTQIVISGTRGKSSLTRWVYDILYNREYDVLAKVTGNRPVSIHSGETHPISRGHRVTLYENEQEIRSHTPADALVVENQAITSYTTRMVNDRFVDPDVVVLSNVREDHLSTLGSDRYKVARGLVRAIPEGTHVINAEQDPHIREFLETEIARRNATVSHVTVPEQYEHIPGIESIYALNEILRAIDEVPLTDDELAVYRNQMDVEWQQLAGGRVYNAAEVNDVQSTEMIRQALFAKDPAIDRIEPFLYLRGDRRGRSVSFLHYLNDLYDRDDPVFDRVHVAGGTTSAFARKAAFPVTVHETETPADDVLQSLLENERPVYIMGNTVATFMRDLEDAIEERELPAETWHSADQSDEPRQTPTDEAASPSASTEPPKQTKTVEIPDN
ncbi:Mur ligase family CapB protein [Natrialba aegyptia DSM 13077]|uniref:Mur ligase family CapB protein n=1 Tax=Natrialba aegyptia DSM 13077 TaxID=1227491 RepID=M0BLD0_9EURY|nr:Mur ligase family CapB protein [Natrialba aegyptia DSM 13077]